MNRRGFFKVVTGFVAGIFAGSVEGKKHPSLRDFDAHYVLGDDFDEYDLTTGEKSTGIDPNSEWAKQKPLTLDMLIKAKEELDQMERFRIEAALKSSMSCVCLLPKWRN